MLYMQIAAVLVGVLFLIPSSVWDTLTKYLKGVGEKGLSPEKIVVDSKLDISSIVSDWSNLRTRFVDAGMKDAVLKMDEMFPTFLQVYNEK